MSSRLLPKGWRLQIGWLKASRLSSIARGGIFQSEKDELLCELEQAFADKKEAEKQADEDVVRL